MVPFHPTFSLLVLVSFLGLFSCEKESDCEENNTYSVVVENTFFDGVLQVNVDDDFTSVNGPGEYSVQAGESLTIQVSSGRHTIKARLVTSQTVGGRVQVNVTGLPDKEVDQRTCETTTLVY